MPRKPQLVLYEHEAEIYIANLVTRKGTIAGKSEKLKTRKALAEFFTVLIKRGHSYPDTADYDTYKGGNNDKTTRDNVSRIEKFFAWLQEKEIDRMPEKETTATVDTQTSQPDLFPTNDSENAPATWPESDAVSEPARSKPGRKVLDTENGEKKSEKLMLYLTPQLIAKIRTWCDLKGISAVSYITSLIEADLDSKQDKINLFLEMRNNL